MTEEHRGAIPFADFPDPVVAYTVVEGEPRLTALNGAFESAFDGPSAGTPVAILFEQFSVVTTTGGEEPLTHLSRGDCVGIYLDDVDENGPFFARVVPSGGDSGFLVFSDLSECRDIAEAPAIDEVSSVISHDLRNPLDVAKAHLRAARETGDAQHFDAVADAHDRMEQIIRDVLTITREQTAVEPSDDVSIEAAARDAWRSVDTAHATLDVTDHLPTATADADRLQRLFENLFRNSVEHGSTSNRTASGDSVEHNSTGSRAVSDTGVERGSDVDDRSTDREREKSAGPGTNITVGALEDGFYVADDGPGIPPDERDRVFEPGFSTRDDGTGLGLAIVDRIVAAHGWELTLTTSTNGGARFEIRSL
ncbi:MAG: sensor histidine kinase [Haloplanus sp.]